MGKGLTRTATDVLHMRVFRILLVLYSPEREGAPIELPFDLTCTSHSVSTSNGVSVQVRMVKLHGIYGDG